MIIQGRYPIGRILPCGACRILREEHKGPEKGASKSQDPFNEMTNNGVKLEQSFAEVKNI
jgi:hypothetical protein